MKNVKVDKLGRIVIPIEFRKQFDIVENSELLLKISGSKIVLMPCATTCRLCGKEIPQNDIPLCAECIRHIKSIN